MAKTKKWASYGITAKHTNPSTKRIESVKVRVDKGAEGFAAAFIWSKEGVIKSMNEGYTFYTALWDSVRKEWNPGAAVRKLVTKNGAFLRTDANQTEADNLENLPEF